MRRISSTTAGRSLECALTCAWQEAEADDFGWRERLAVEDKPPPRATVELH